MANLLGKTLEGSFSLDLAPVESQVLGQDATDYVLTINLGQNSSSLHRRFSVAEWQTQHDDLWMFARGFMETPTLRETKIPINLWPTEGGRQADLFLSASWIEAVVWGYKRSKQIRIVFFVGKSLSNASFDRLLVLTDVDRTRDFGSELAKEIIQACPHWASEQDFVSAKNF